MLPENEPLQGLEQRELTALRAAVQEGVRACREALSVWFTSSESQPLEEAVNQAASKMLRLVGTLEEGAPGPATHVLVRILLISIIEEMGRPHVLQLN